MSEHLTALAMLAGLMGVFAIIFRGMLPKRRGPGIGGPLTRLTSPGDVPITTAGLAALAVGTALAPWVRSSTSAGITIGLVVGVPIAIRLTRAWALRVCGVVAALLAVLAALQFMAGRGEADALATWFRTCLMLLVFASFVLGVVIFDRSKALEGKRGLALWGMVEIVTFLAAPSGRDIFGLNGVGATTIIAVSCVVAVVLGALVSEYLLGLVGIGVALTVWYGNAVVGTVEEGAPQAAWVGFVAGITAAAAVLIGSRLSRVARVR